MPTARDRVWMVTLRLAKDRTGVSAKVVRNAAREVFDEDAPSRGTVNDTLNAMTEMGVLERLGRKGQPAHYVLSEDWQG